MPDREKSTPQPPESERALRETFLWRFDDPEHRETLQRLGDLLFLLANEAHMWGSTKGWGLIPGQLNAAADDLEHLAGYLFEVAGEPTWSEVDREDLDLCARAETWAGQVRAIVSEIHQAISPEPEATETTPEEQLLEDLRALRQRAGQLQMLRTPGSIAHRLSRALDAFLRSETNGEPE